LKEVEEGVDSVVLTCSGDGNPKPDIVWRKLGQQSIFRLEDQLKFRYANKITSDHALSLGSDLHLVNLGTNA
jgi:hypothetical protein